MFTLRVRSSLAPLTLLSLSCALAFVACSGKQSSSSDLGPLPTGFGGFGGFVNAQPAGSAGIGVSRAGSGGDTNTPAPSCQNVPKGRVALIDDFEDGNTAAAQELYREGFWGTVHDETTGELLPLGEFAPEAGGREGSRYGAHVKASGYSEWGALISTTLTYLWEDVHCPYNASAFAGLRFYAKGSGRVRVGLPVPATQHKEFGGACDPEKGQICYDVHSAFVTLAPEWTLYELPWSDFRQRGFGTPAEFRPDQIVIVQFSFDNDVLPVEIWLDDLSFWDGVSTPTTMGTGGTGSGGTGGTGSGGTGGTGSGGTGGIAGTAGNSAAGDSAGGASGASSANEAGAGGVAGFAGEATP